MCPEKSNLGITEDNDLKTAIVHRPKELKKGVNECQNEDLKKKYHEHLNEIMITF